MSKALKCDICGGFFNGLSCINVVNKKTMPNDMMIYYRASNGNTKTVFDYDICPECYLAIKKAIDARRKKTDPFEDDLK